MSQLSIRIRNRARSLFGLDWLQEARRIAKEAEKQRNEDEARAALDPHDFARWMQDPAPFRRPAPENRYDSD